MKEQIIQTKIIKYLEAKGFIVVNMIKTNKSGIPDLLTLTGDGQHFWIEVKKPGGVLSVLQKYRINTLEVLGDKILVPYGYDDFLKQYNKWMI